MVAANPADALGLTDRGRIETGRRADLLLVDPGQDSAQADVIATLVEGRRAFMSTAG